MANNLFQNDNIVGNSLIGFEFRGIFDYNENEMIEKLKNAGFVIEEDPEIIASVIRSLFLLTLHRKEVGVEFYTETIELFIDMIVDGLIKGEED